ncbi:MAG: hypothetical protein M0R17_06065 [Candidatus Omnitrophica bacterium]|jgi:hypothetical protein|nr:hypothetical protein [Candidatus Omnitrophota bacterium]
MALSGKGESGVTANVEKYYQAILWGDTSKFSQEEKKILNELHTNLQGSYAEKQQQVKIEPLKSGTTFDVRFTSQGAEYTNIREPTTTTRTQQQTDVFGRDVSRITSTDINIAAETVRYKQLGYSESEAGKLARASASVGGMSFSPDKAKEIIASKTPYGNTIRIEKALSLLETSQPSISLEKEKTRYKQLGYSESEAKTLAGESISRGGVSFNPDEAKRIINKTDSYLTGKVVYKPEEVKKTPSGKVETYSSFLDAFISESPTGGQGTVYARAPTINERIKLESKNEIQNILSIGKQAKDKFVDIELSLSKIESLDKSIEALEKDFLKNGKFVGSKKYLDMYEKQIEQRNEEVKQLTSYGVTISSTGQISYPTIKMKFFGETQEVPINEISKGAFNVFETLVGGAYKKSIEESKIKLPNVLYYTGMVVEKTGTELGQIIREPSRVKDYFAPKPKYVMDLTTGAFREVTLEDIPKRMTWEERGKIKPESIWTTEEIAKGAYGVTKTATIFGLETGKYALASALGIGVPLMIYETTKGIGEEGGVVEFIKERPIQAGALAVTALFTLGKSKAVQSFLGTKLRFGMLPQEGVSVLKKKVYLDILPSKIKQQEINLLAKNILQTEAREFALSTQKRIVGQEAITKSELEWKKLGLKFTPSKPQTYVEQGGFLKEYTSIDVGKGTTLWSEIKSSLGTKEFKTISKEGVITVRKFEIMPTSGKLKLSPDVGVYQGIQVVPRISTSVGKRVNVIGVSGASKELGGNIVNLEGFVGAGGGRYIVFKSWKTKVGRKGIADYGLVGKETGTQIAKVTKVKEGYKVEYRQLPQDKNLYQYDVKELLEKRVGKTTFEKGIPIKTEILKYKEVPTKKGYQLDVLLKPEETLIGRSVILKKDILGSVTNIPTKVDKTGEVISLVSGKKTSLSSSFGGQVEQQVTKQELTSVLKKVTPVTMPVIKVPKVTTPLVESLYPTYTGGIGLFGGLGIGTVSASEISYIEPTIISTPKEFSLSLTGNVVEQPRVDTSVKQFTTTQEVLKTKQEQVQRQLEIPKQKFSLSFKPSELLKEQQAVSQVQALGLKQQSKQLQKNELLNKLISKVKTQPKTPTPKIKVPVPFKLSSFGFERKQTAIEKVKDIFEVYAGKKGKEEMIGEEFNILKAGTKLKKGLKETLKASGFVLEKKTGRRVTFGELAEVLGGEFRAGKNDITRIVQRKEKTALFGSRLGSKKERQLIQLAKGKKKKGWF